jgi:hypothetical protein
MKVLNNLRIKKFKNLIQKILKPEKIQKIQLKHKLSASNPKSFRCKNKIMKKRIKNKKIQTDKTCLVLKIPQMIISK